MSHWTWSDSPSSTPPSAASAPPSTQTTRMTRFDVDAGRGGQVTVVGDGAHGLADLGPLQHEGDADQDDHRQDDRVEVAVGQGQQPVVPGPLRLVVRCRRGPSAVEGLDRVPGGEREPDRDDQCGDQAGAPAAERPPDPELVRRSDESADDHGDQCGHDQRDAVRLK